MVQYCKSLWDTLAYILIWTSVKNFKPESGGAGHLAPGTDFYRRGPVCSSFFVPFWSLKTPPSITSHVSFHLAGLIF